MSDFQTLCCLVTKRFFVTAFQQQVIYKIGESRHEMMIIKTILKKLIRHIISSVQDRDRK